MGTSSGPQALANNGDVYQRDGSTPYLHHTLVVAGSPTTPNITLEGSVDGQNWFQLALTAASQGATVTTNAATTTGIFTTTTDVPLPLVRAKRNSLAGGTVNVAIVSA